MRVVYADNQTYYDELFAKMQAFLSENKIDTTVKIDKIYTYYQFLDKIRNLGRYDLLRVPAQEEMFTIDANTREIKVPKHFQDNGLGVSGDQRAEIVYFEIPRFFDEMDLSLCAAQTKPTDGSQAQPLGECVILWTRTEANGSKSSGGIEAYALDVREDSIIFGWIITDKLTQTAGSFQFAIRIAMWEEHAPNTYTYSFNTLPAICKIQGGINTKWDTPPAAIEKVNDIMYHRPLYSGVVDSMFGAMPVITKDLETTADLTENGTYDLVVQAYSPTNSSEDYTNAGLSDYWYTSSSNASSTLITENTEVSGPVINSDNYEIYTFKCVVNDAGSYVLTLGNQNNLGVRYLKSATCVIPGPNEFRIETNNVSRVYANSTIDENNKVVARAINANGADSHLPSAYNGVTYQWQTSNLLKEGYVNIDGATSEEYSPRDVDGYVRCKITNKRNKHSLEQFSEPVLVRKDPTAETFDLTIQSVTRQASGGYTVVCKFHSENMDYRNLYSSLEDQYASNYLISNAPIYEDMIDKTNQTVTYRNITGITANSKLYWKVRRVVWENTALQRESAWSSSTNIFEIE